MVCVNTTGYDGYEEKKKTTIDIQLIDNNLFHLLIALSSKEKHKSTDFPYMHHETSLKLKNFHFLYFCVTFPVFM